MLSEFWPVWPRLSHRPGNYWISRPAPLIYLPIISLYLRHVTQSVKIFVDKRPDINLLNLWISCIGVKAEMVKWRRHVFQSLLRLLSNTAYMSAGGVPVSRISISPRIWAVPGNFLAVAHITQHWRYEAGVYHGLTQHQTSNTQNSSPNTIQHLTSLLQYGANGACNMLISRDFVACYCSSGSNVCRYLNFH